MDAALLPGDEALARYLAQREPLYRVKPPRYLVAMLRQFESLRRGRGERLLDVGGGTGLVAQCLADHFALSQVHTIDVADRFRADLTIAHSTFDGVAVPFEAGRFDCATLFNVLHHVPTHARVGLLRDIGRATASGPIYVKDHLAASALDHWRLAALDLLGNAPFGGMIEASYLTQADWDALAQAAGYRIAAQESAPYRSGLMRMAFPNRLEIMMRLEPLA